MSDFNLATADKASLKAWAINNIDLNLSLTMNEETMRQRILDKCDKLKIDPPAAKVKAKGGAAKNKKTKYITINVAKQTGPGGSEPAFVGVQGVGYTIPRGMNIDVPESVVEALNNAVQDIVTQDPDTAEMMHEDVLTYPFQIVGVAA